jgi:hypothetical protein
MTHCPPIEASGQIRSRQEGRLAGEISGVQTLGVMVFPNGICDQGVNLFTSPETRHESFVEKFYTRINFFN